MRLDGLASKAGWTGRSWLPRFSRHGLFAGFGHNLSPLARPAVPWSCLRSRRLKTLSKAGKCLSSHELSKRPGPLKSSPSRIAWGLPNSESQIPSLPSLMECDGIIHIPGARAQASRNIHISASTVIADTISERGPNGEGEDASACGWQQSRTVLP